MTKDELLQEMAFWGKRHGKAYSPADADAWYPLFKDYEPFQLRQSALMHSSRSPFPPKPSDLLPNLIEQKERASMNDPAKEAYKKSYEEREAEILLQVMELTNRFMKARTEEERKMLWAEKKKADQKHSELWLSFVHGNMV